MNENELDIPLGELAGQRPNAITQHLEELSHGELPEKPLHDDVGEIGLMDAVQVEREIGQVPRSVLSKLQSMGINSLDVLAERPDLIHQLPEYLTRLERVAVFDTLLKVIHPDFIRRPYSGSTVESRTLPEEKPQGQVYRLIINTLRNFAYDVPQNANRERLQVKTYAKEILDELENNPPNRPEFGPPEPEEIQENSEQSRAEQIPFDKMQEILNLTGDEQFEAFRDWVNQLPMVDPDHPPLNIDPTHRHPHGGRENELTSVFLPERLAFIQELGEACLENGSILSVDVFRSSLDARPGVIPYIALNVKLKGNKGEIFDAVILERPEKVEIKNLATGQITEKIDDATYIFVSEIPGIWKDVFYQGAEKKAVRFEGSLRNYHNPNHVQNVIKTLDDMIDGIKDKSLPFPHTNPYQ